MLAVSQRPCGRVASTFEAYAIDAGFSGVDVLDLEHDTFRFYRLRS